MSKCCVPSCPAGRDDQQIACRAHWFSVPLELRNRIWRHFRERRGSHEHLMAVREAIRWLRDRDQVTA